MKIILYIFSLLIFNNLFAQNDTINSFDKNQMKQGFWIITFDNTDKVLEEGSYKDNEREGIWKQYLDNGTISSEITYLNDEPHGYAKVYYPNGKVLEEGLWKDDAWVGEYKAYYKNGNLNYKWRFSDDGQRTGKQEYYHENGKKMVEGVWDNGKESGVIKRYNEKGTLIEEQTYDNGKINPELTVEYTPKAEKQIVKEVEIVKKDSIRNKELDAFTTTGDRKLYDKKRQLTHEGYFENGKLIKGKKYYYNSEGELVKTEIYSKGKLYNTIKVEQ